jgi:hypothetical protein
MHLQNVLETRCAVLRRRRLLPLRRPRIPQLWRLGLRLLQLVRQSDQHLGLHQLDLLLHRLSALPQSVSRSEHRGAVEVLCAGVQRLHRLGNVHVAVSAEWVYSLLPQQVVCVELLTACVGILIFVAIYLAHRVVFRHDKWVGDLEEVDMQTGLEEVMECEKPPEKRKGWKRVFMVIE